MNQKEFLSWIESNSQWIIDKFENLENYENNNDDLKVGDIIIYSSSIGTSKLQPLNIHLIEDINIYNRHTNQEWVSYFFQTGYIKRDKSKFSNKKLIIHKPLSGQPYKDSKFTYLMEIQMQKGYVVGNISKKPFLNWSQETPWEKLS